MAYSERQKRILHRLGYYHYQNGLIYRHLNQGKGWNLHLQNCRSFILRSVEMLNPETVTVLGSGWLLDLPLKELSERTKKVNLVDIVHPPDAFRQVEPLKNVVLTEADATGGLIDEVWAKTSGLRLFGKLKSLDSINIPCYELNEPGNLVVSLNLLTQLETLLIRRLKEKSVLGEDDFLKFRKAVQKKHIDFLLQHNSVLITDTCETFIDKKGNRSDIETVVTDLPFGTVREEWTWDFDLVRSDFYEMNSVLKVVALLLKK
jgi:hypothetical protein